MFNICLITLTYILVDILWMRVIAHQFYVRHLGHLLKPTIHAPAALCAWGLIILGQIYFVYQPGASIGMQIARGALFGLVVYGTYEFTNYAIVNQWPLSVLLVDIAWGVLLNMFIALLYAWLMGI